MKEWICVIHWRRELDQGGRLQWVVSYRAGDKTGALVLEELRAR